MNNLMLNVLYDGIDKEIESLKIELAKTEDNTRRQEIIGDLYKLQDLKNKRDLYKIKPNDLLKAAVGVLTVLAVLKYEEANIITTKAWGFVTGFLK